ncbi:MAG: putative membrane protein [Acidimicrobiales bacterium]|nr:putative membrane protein [Acidimicrobiales bacterium]
MSTAGRPTPSGARTRRGWLLWPVLAVALVAVVLVAGRPSGEGEPLSPESTGPLGLKGLVELLESFGAEVEVVGSGVDGFDVAFVPVPSTLSGEQIEELRDFARGGGRVVLAAPSEELSPAVLGLAPGLGGFGATLLEPGSCDITELVDAGTVESAGGFEFFVEAGYRSCYGDAGAAFVVAGPLGEGEVISVGGAGFFVNENLAAPIDESGLVSNSVVAVRLMVRSPGTRVAFYQTATEELADVTGDKSVTDFLSDGVKLGLVQLAVALIVYALYRARRLGRPISEPQPVEIAGSELVDAVGNLMRRSGSIEAAASLLRDHTRRGLCSALGLPLEAPTEVVADMAGARLGLDSEGLNAALGARPVHTEQQLVELARDLESIRWEVLHGERR